MLFLAGALVLCGDVYDAVCVDIKGDLNLRHAAGSGGDAVQDEATQRGVVRRHFALALQHVDFHRGLTVRRSGVDLALLDRDGGVPVDDPVEHAAQRLNAQGQRRDIQQQQILDLAAQNAALDCRTDCNALIGVDALEGILADELLHGILHRRDSRGAADQQDLVDLTDIQTRVRQRLLGRNHRALDQVSGDAVELGSGQCRLKVERSVRRCGDEGQVDAGAGHAGQLDLCLFRRVTQSLQDHFVLPQIDAVLPLEAVRHPVNDSLVEVVAAEMRVAVGGKHLKHAVRDLQKRDIEGTAAEVEDHDLLILFLIHAVGKRRRGRLVDDPEHLQTRDLAGVLGCLTLCVREIRRNGDDRLADRGSQVSLRVRLQLLQNHCGNFLRGVGLAVNFLLVGGAHLPLDRNDRAVGVGDRLSFCDLTDHSLSGLGECHDRRRGARAFGVRNHDGLTALVNRHTGVGCTQINTDNLSHNHYLRIFRYLSII